MKEVDHVHPQGVSDKQEMTQFHLAAALHSLDGRPVQAGLVCQGLLGEVEVQPPDADAVADGPSGVEDPRRMVWGWHPINALATMIISQQQNCGII